MNMRRDYWVRIFNRVNYIGPWGANIVTTRDIVDVKLFMK